MFKNFNFNLDGLMYLLVGIIIELGFQLVCIQYGISRIDRIIAISSICFSIIFINKSLKEFNIKN